MREHFNKRRPSRREIELALRLYTPKHKEEDKTTMTQRAAKNKANETAAGGSSQALVTREQAGTALERAAMEETGVAYTIPAELSIEFSNVLAEIEQGFGGFTKAGDVFKRCEAGETFALIGGYTTELLNVDDGVLEPKHVFVLEMSNGDVLRVMQSDSTIRAKYAQAFTLARMHNVDLRLEPMRFVEHRGRVRQPQPAFILQTLPGFRQHATPRGRQVALSATMPQG